MTLIEVSKTDNCCMDCGCCNKKVETFVTDTIYVYIEGNVLNISTYYDANRSLTFFASELEQVIDIYLKATKRNQKYMYKKLSKTKYANDLIDIKHELQQRYEQYFAVTHVSIYDQRRAVSVPVSQLHRIHVEEFNDD